MTLQGSQGVLLQSTSTRPGTATDTTKPVINNVPADIVADATSPNGATVNYTMPTATDPVDGNVTVTASGGVAIGVDYSCLDDGDNGWGFILDSARFISQGGPGAALRLG